jgi:hypothetical protein
MPKLWDVCLLPYQLVRIALHVSTVMVRPQKHPDATSIDI